VSFWPNQETGNASKIEPTTIRTISRARAPHRPKSPSDASYHHPEAIIGNRRYERPEFRTQLNRPSP
jgi:hypothetical protein